MRTIIILSVLLISRCGHSDQRLQIENTTSKGVYYIYSKGYVLNHIERVDRFVDARSRMGDTSYVNYLPPKSITRIIVNSTWEGYVESTPGERINFFFFPVDTLSRYTWEEIMEGRRYSNMLSYKISDLERMNWLITYPAENYKVPSGRGLFNNKTLLKMLNIDSTFR